MSAILHVVIVLVGLALLFRLVLHLSLLVALLFSALTAGDPSTLLDPHAYWLVSLLVSLGIGFVGAYYYFAQSGRRWFHR